MSHLSFLAIVVAVVLRACESTLLLRDTKHSANGRRLNANFTLWKRKMRPVDLMSLPCSARPSAVPEM